MDNAWGAATSHGNRRTVNEDSFLAGLPVFVVADGMGGHQHGDIASSIAVDEFSKLSQYSVINPGLVDATFQRAASRLRDSLTKGVGGTTVCGVGVTLQDGAPYWLVFNLGDSRAYRLQGAHGDPGARGGTQLEQISVDHSVVQELIDSGAVDRSAAHTHTQRHVITKALETQSTPLPDYWMLPVESGDEIMLCSDGLTDELDDEEIEAIWATSLNPQHAAEQLVASAVTAGGRDNVTVVIVTSAVVGYAAAQVQESTGTSHDATTELPPAVALDETFEHTTPRYPRS
ncbi:PP2C family protein-serine/threonine phosphatase [Jonesia denitrificans]|uniref:Protein serine/threonine phosphatase n=1 Tax=Jonesia denitrificans (strain ATCC 14870 / DSM 20603 / BCRC 15368 / CIP 55.134 / JCM 11481 / NBRC 15587 / NCTC 10816 / Prevot 55134) TaxID=471856 RepID=C7R062_JONDD|nr:protein phosphatase 2C domain-containing protein [Jonesia denitrificans]ACV08121.1 protein serine/threonine phosphatase [Jonesia denitrificans DSM 20603]ASE08202.1 serine/threonine-protein phosphatase [Jonesia denitrificans]QXB42801.1 protein phosphatase 2C domain-containing protein [Jonesia denitrificans]SQH20102.1 Serine/threonine phosphatase stp [Jonesia denitrificans]